MTKMRKINIQPRERQDGVKKTTRRRKQTTIIWNLGPPHLSLNPPCFFVLFYFRFLCFCVSEKKAAVFTWKRGYFCSFFECLRCFSLACLTSPFHSLSLPRYFLAFLLPCFLTFLLPCFLFVVLGLFPCICFMQRTTSNYHIFINIFLFLVSRSFKSPFLIFTFSFGPTSPNPALLWCLCYSCCCFSFFVLVLCLLLLLCFCLHRMSKKGRVGPLSTCGPGSKNSFGSGCFGA